MSALTLNVERRKGEEVCRIHFKHYHFQQSACTWISPHLLLPPHYFLCSLSVHPQRAQAVSLQPDCSNKSSLSPLPCRLFPFAVSLFLAPCSSPQSSNENHILGLMRVMGCEVGVCCLCDSSCDACTDCGK